MNNSLLFDMIYVSDLVRMQMIQIKDIRFVCSFNEIVNDYFFRGELYYLEVKFL
jgi:hypothetical protein